MILPYAALALLALSTVYSAIVSFRQHEGGHPSWIFPEPPGRYTRIGVVVLSLALLTGLGFWLGMNARHSTRRPARFLIPEGYSGWIRVEFEVQGAPVLPMEGSEYVVKIPANGILRTSSPEQNGWAKDHYYYYSAQGIRPLSDSGQASLIWGKLNAEEAGTSVKRKYKEFFVGTVQQFKDQARE